MVVDNFVKSLKSFVVCVVLFLLWELVNYIVFAVYYYCSSL